MLDERTPRPGKILPFSAATSEVSEALAAPAPPGKLAVVVTYVEMHRRPAPSTVGRRAEPCAVLRAEAPTVSFYRFLYNTVGQPWLWYERRLLDDEMLHQAIMSPGVEIYVLYVRGVPAGYVELDRQRLGEVEIAYFGLMPEFIGRGLGPYFLDWAVGRAWDPPQGNAPERVWLHTCTLDHPKALATYQRAGFEVYDRQEILIDDPRLKIAF